MIKIFLKKLYEIVKIPYYFFLILKVIKIKPVKSGFVVVSPSLTLSGAPLLSRAIYHEIKDSDDCIFVSVYGGRGITVDNSLNLNGCKLDSIQKAIFKLLSNRGYKKYILNSIVSGSISGNLDLENTQSITLIHEMMSAIKAFSLESQVTDIAINSKALVFSSQSTYNNIFGLSKFDISNKSRFIKQGLYSKEVLDNLKYRQVVRDGFREKYNIKEGQIVVLGIGNDFVRKGFKYFNELSLSLEEQFKFVWIGDRSNAKNNHEFNDNILFIDKVPSCDIYKNYYMSDVFFLSSIEDPFPSVILEAMGAGIPVMSIRGSGGADEIVDDRNGLIINSSDISEGYRYLKSLNKDKLQKYQINNPKLIRERYSMTKYVLSLKEEF